MGAESKQEGLGGGRGKQALAGRAAAYREGVRIYRAAGAAPSVLGGVGFHSWGGSGSSSKHSHTSSVHHAASSWTWLVRVLLQPAIRPLTAAFQGRGGADAGWPCTPLPGCGRRRSAAAPPLQPAAVPSAAQACLAHLCEFADDPLPRCRHRLAKCQLRKVRSRGSGGEAARHATRSARLRQAHASATPPPPLPSPARGLKTHPLLEHRPQPGVLDAARLHPAQQQHACSTDRLSAGGSGGGLGGVARAAGGRAAVTTPCSCAVWCPGARPWVQSSGRDAPDDPRALQGAQQHEGHDALHDEIAHDAHGAATAAAGSQARRFFGVGTGELLPLAGLCSDVEAFLGRREDGEGSNSG